MRAIPILSDVHHELPYRWLSHSAAPSRDKFCSQLPGSADKLQSECASAPEH